LQQIQGQLNSMSAADIKTAYDSALDTQQRLFVMRGQLDKLQNDRTHLDKYKEFLVLVRDALSAGLNAGKSGKAGATMSPGIDMIINAQEAERQRLSRQMHDGPVQALSNFIIQTEIAMRLFDVDAAQAKTELGNLKASAMGTFQKVRNFIFELRPMMLDDLGIIPTVKRYCEAFREQTSLDTSLNVSGAERRLEPFVEVMIFRSLQEILGNAARHSHASQIKVHMDVSELMAKVSVDDNGRGFDPDVLNQGSSLGLKLIKERVEMLGGNFEIDSTAGKGTRITFSIPAQAH
jgi:two-component system sensor histidine kinase DegS